VVHRRTAFALAGLGGNNAHGAGFLSAAQTLQRQREESGRAASPGGGHPAPGRMSAQEQERARRHILPELEFVSCTSGAIATVLTYLRGDDVRADTERRIEAVLRASRLPRSAWADDWRGLVVPLLTGVPGVFGPWVEAYRRHLWRRLRGFVDPRSPFFGAVPTTPEELYDLWLPAATFVPKLPESFFAEAAEVFTDARTGVGVAFNSFDPATGIEQLYVNDAALHRIAEHYDPLCDYGRTHRHTVYRPITADAVRAALWLIGYGFADDRLNPQELVDGAYARSIVLNELTGAERIYAVKPVNDRWLGRLPQNAFEVADMQTEFWWESSYREQSRLIETINELHAAGRLAAPQAARAADAATTDRIEAVRTRPYRHVELIPVEIETQRGFFRYFVEDLEVFRDAYGQSLRLLTGKDEGDELRSRSPAAELT
jgi:hypothetical protein